MIQELQNNHKQEENELHQQLEEQEMANQDLHVSVKQLILRSRDQLHPS